MKTVTPYFLAVLFLFVPGIDAASFLDKIGLGKTSSNATPALTAVLSQDEISGALKEALAKGVERAVSALGQNDGFLKDANVKIPMPENLQKVERTLRSLGQEKLADEFVTTMNRAAEQAVPEAAAVLGGAVKQMTVADAKAILTSTNNAATAYFRRTSTTNLYERFLPIVRTATEQTGVTAAYKKMIEKASFGGFSAASLLGQNSADLDGYITRKALDGLFLKIGQEEERIRENPAARTTDLLQKVFGAVSKPAASPTKP
jgi:hypothetical protein